MQIALLLAYPLLVHLAVLSNRVEIQSLALIFFAAGLCYQGLKSGSVVAWLFMAAGVVVAILMSYLNLAQYAFYLPPVLIPLLFWSVFQRSLTSGQTPLVTLIGESVHGTFDEGMRRYTRKVTQIWSVLFLLLSAISLLLAVFASTEVWSLGTNFYAYLLIAALFVSEYIYRKWRFSHLQHPAFGEYLQIVFRADIRNL